MNYLIIFCFVLLFCLFLNELGIIFIYLIFKIVKYSEKDVLLSFVECIVWLKIRFLMFLINDMLFYRLVIYD